VKPPAIFCNRRLKNIKAFLLQHNWKLKRIHELDALLDDAVKFRPELGLFYPLCEKISGYYFSERYPPLSKEGISAKDMGKNIADAENFINALFPPKNK